MNISIAYNEVDYAFSMDKTYRATISREKSMKATKTMDFPFRIRMGFCIFVHVIDSFAVHTNR